MNEKERRVREVGIPATLYQLAPLVMPSSKYSSGYRSSQGCPLCIRGFSCTHKNTHKWELNNEHCCTQVFKPCLSQIFYMASISAPAPHFVFNHNVKPQTDIIPAWNRSGLNSVQLPVSTLWTAAGRPCRQATGCTVISLLCHHQRGSWPPRNLNPTTQR